MAPAKAVHELFELLKHTGREALMPRIAKAFARIAEREGAKQAMTISVAREKDERHAKSVAKEVLAKLGVEAKELLVRVDDSLIGGWRAEGREVLVDRSYKRRLVDLFNKSVS